MNTKEKRGKAIIGIAMAAIMLASVFAAMVPTASAAAGPEREGSPDAVTFDVIYQGEKINFTQGVNQSYLVKFYRIDDSNEIFEFEVMPNTAKRVTASIAPKGSYNLTYVPAGSVTREGRSMTITTPSVEIKIVNMAGEDIESTTAGQEIKLDTSSLSLPTDDVVKVKWEDPKGHKETLDTKTVSNLTGWSTFTTGWRSGDHNIWIETVEEKARGLDLVSDKDTITIFKEEITIEAENEEPVVAEEVLITVRAPPDQLFNFTTNHPEDVIMTSKEKNPLGLPSGVAVPMDNQTYVIDVFGEKGKFNGTTNEDGLYKFVVKFTEDRTYKFEVEYNAKAEEDDIELDVEKADVIFDMLATCLIGEDLTITGTIAEGESVAIYIDDDLFKASAGLTDGVFEEDWDTKGKKTGSYRIDVYIDLEDKMTPPNDKDDIEGIDEDGTTTVRLIEPGLSAEQPRDVIAEEDDYVVEGTATGVSVVDIVIIGPDGYDGGGYDIETGLAFVEESVDSDNLFETEIDTKKADSGKYMVLVFIPGRDGYYGNSDQHEDGDLEAYLTAGETGGFGYSFNGKNKAQIVSMITDVTTEETGSDDMMVVLEFTIESPYVTLDAIEDVGAGKPLIVSGTTNREDGTVIMVTLTGPVETSATGEVTDNKFNVTIDTTDLKVGVYTVEADDGDGHIDTATVEILEEAAPTPEPTAEPTATPTPTATAVPTPEPTAEPTAEPTPEPPGFEAVFAIAGMLSIAYLVLRKRRE